MKHKLLKKIMIAVLIVAGILLVLFVSREVAVRRFGYKLPALSESQLKKAKAVDVPLDKGESFKHAVTENYIYFINPDKVMIADIKGKFVAEEEIITSDPVVHRMGNYVIVGDIGGNNVYIFENEEIKTSITTSGAIVEANVNSSGYSIVVTQGDMHKRDVTVYDPKGDDLFVWNSGSLFVLNAAIADNNKNIIISTLDTNEGKMKSILSFYNISQTEPIATEEYDNELLAALEMCGNYVYCIGDSKACVYRVTGEKNTEIPYMGKTMITYKTDDTNIAIAFSETSLSGKRYDIETYNISGKQIGAYELDYKINYIDYEEDTIAISRGRLINVVDTSGREKKLVDPGVDLLSMDFIKDGAKAVGFTAQGAYIFKIS